MTNETMDAAKAEAFAGQMIGYINDALIALLISVGHRAALFDKMSVLPLSSGDEIACATGLNERYVREWLRGMTTAGIVEHNGARGTYSLPREHAGSITRAAGPANLANMTTMIALFGTVEDNVVDSFRNGGVPYSAFPKFQEFMANASGQVFDATLVRATLPLVEGLQDRLRAGMDGSTKSTKESFGEREDRFASSTGGLAARVATQGAPVQCATAKAT